MKKDSEYNSEQIWISLMSDLIEMHSVKNPDEMHGYDAPLQVIFHNNKQCDDRNYLSIKALQIVYL